MTPNQPKSLQQFELFSVVAFGLAYWKFDLQIATMVLAIWLTVMVVFAWTKKLPLTKMQLISWVAVLVLGIPSILLQDEQLIKWKPTVVNSIIATMFVGSHFVGRNTIFEKLVAAKLSAPRHMLRKVNFAISLYLYFVAATNIIVAYSFSTNAWVTFKLFGLLGFNLVFGGGVFMYLKEPIMQWMREQQKA